MEDKEVLSFLRRQASGARYVTGSLVLATAPVAVPVSERVVIDRDRARA
jgi:hypothetical protein